MKYIKHYWISVTTGTYCAHENPVEKRHPEAEFPGLDVKIWMHDQNGIDVCLSTVPDSTSVSDILDNQDENLKVVQVLTEDQFNSVNIPLSESTQLSQQAMMETDELVAQDLRDQSEVKYQEAQEALFSL